MLGGGRGGAGGAGAAGTWRGGAPRASVPRGGGAPPPGAGGSVGAPKAGGVATLGRGHNPHHLGGGVADPGVLLGRPVGFAAQVAHHAAPPRLELSSGTRIRDIAPVAVRDRQFQNLARL